MWKLQIHQCSIISELPMNVLPILALGKDQLLVMLVLHPSVNPKAMEKQMMVRVISKWAMTTAPVVELDKHFAMCVIVCCDVKRMDLTVLSAEDLMLSILPRYSVSK
jgi:hypothetical protein